MQCCGARIHRGITTAGRLKLKKADLQEVANAAVEKLIGKPSGLLGFLLMVTV